MGYKLENMLHLKKNVSYKFCLILVIFGLTLSDVLSEIDWTFISMFVFEYFPLIFMKKLYLYLSITVTLQPLFKIEKKVTKTICWNIIAVHVVQLSAVHYDWIYPEVSIFFFEMPEMVPLEWNSREI